ncbi:MAG: RIP metalloprotease RseP [Candidatus Omnitrophota bacterium]
MGSATDKDTNIMISTLAVLIVFSVLILVHEAGHFFAAKRMGVKVERFSFGFGPKLFSFKKNETEYLICLVPLGGYVKMAGDEPTEERKGAEWEFLSKPPIKRFAIIFSGPLTNYLLSFLLFSLIFVIGTPALTPEVGDVIKDFPAYSAGIMQGDKITSINGKNIEYWDDLLIEISNATTGEKVNISLLRNDKPISVGLVPRIIETKNIFGQVIKVGRLGITSSNNIVTVKTDPFKALYYGAQKTVFLTVLTYKSLWYMITGGMPVKESLAGPVRIVTEIGKAAKLGIVPLLHLTAYINLAIAVFNLLPIPILDGGHILFLGLEKIRKRRLSPKVEQAVTNVALSLLIALFALVTWNDIINIIR